MKFLPIHSEHYRIDAIPQNDSRLLTQYAEGWQISGSFGDVVSQAFRGTDYAIFQHHFNIKHDTFLYALSDRPMLTINYMIKGSPLAKIPGLGELQLAEGSYRLFYVPPVKQQVWFVKGFYHCIHIVFDPAYLRKLADRHDSLRQLLDYALQRSDMLFPHNQGTIDLMMNELLRKITTAREDRGETEIYLRAKVLELLLLYIRKHHNTSDGLSSYIYDDRIDRVEQYIEENLDKPLNIDELIRHFNISRRTLQRQFKMKNGLPISEYYRSLKMERSLETLLSRRFTIGEISHIMGYSDVASFTHAFYRYFKSTPQQVLRQNRI